MNIFKRIFGGSKAGDEAVKGISKGLDALIFTKEEKATYNKEAFQL